MDNQVEKLLNLCLEVEGLLTLIERREENAPAAAWSLLREKAGMLADGVARLNADFVSVSSAEMDAVARSTELEESEDAGTSPCCQPESDVESLPEIGVSADSADEKTDICNESETIRIADVPSGFTLNDKFRFRRELFANSDAEMADALHVVNAMTSVGEIEDYFYNDLCWDPENEDVKDFMRIVTARFI